MRKLDERITQLEASVKRTDIYIERLQEKQAGKKRKLQTLLAERESRKAPAAPEPVNG